MEIAYLHHKGDGAGQLDMEIQGLTRRYKVKPCMSNRACRRRGVSYALKPVYLDLQYHTICPPPSPKLSLSSSLSSPLSYFNSSSPILAAILTLFQALVKLHQALRFNFLTRHDINPHSFTSLAHFQGPQVESDPLKFCSCLTSNQHLHSSSLSLLPASTETSPIFNTKRPTSALHSLQDRL